MGIEKGRPFEQSPKMKGVFNEAMQEKKLSESPKPLILLGFSKSSVSPLGPEIGKLRQGVCRFSFGLYFLPAMCYICHEMVSNRSLRGCVYV